VEGKEGQVETVKTIVWGEQDRQEVRAHDTRKISLKQNNTFSIKNNQNSINT